MKKMFFGLCRSLSKHRLMTRVLCVIICLLLIFYAAPPILYTKAAEAMNESEADNVPFVYSEERANELSQIYEDKQRREESVKHFMLSDGTYIAAQYPYAVHYLDTDGNWQDIDNSLSPNIQGFYTTANARIRFSKKTTGNGRLFTLSDSDTSLTLSLLNANKGVRGVVSEENDSTYETELNRALSLNGLNSSVTYYDVLDGVDIEYVLSSLNIKENIIVKQRKASYSYSFELKLTGLTAELTANGNIEIKNDGNIQYIIPAPLVYDAKDSIAPLDVAHYTLQNCGNGKYTLEVAVLSEWMNASDRAFPVTVDPAIFTVGFNSQDTYISSSNPSTSYGESGSLAVSSHQTAYWKVNELPALPPGANITGATVSFYGSSSADSYVGAYKVTTAWDELLTYSQYTDTASPKGAYENTYVDYRIVNTSGYYSFDITELYKLWHSGTLANHGIALKPLGSHTANATFCSTDYTYTSSRPYLTVSYIDSKGLEGYMPYSTHSIGQGTGSINLATGELTLAFPLLSTTDYLMPTVVGLVYNSSLSGLEYTYGNSGIGYTSSFTPYGFKLNITETLIKKSYTDLSGDVSYYYVYSDSDGTEHSFQAAATQGVYKDCDGLQITLSEKTDGTVTLTDDSKITKAFTPMSTSPTGTVSAFYLSKITDAPGNSVEFGFNSEHKPVSVSLKPYNQSAIKMLDLYYDSTGKLKAIYNSVSLDAAVLRYSSSYNSATSSTGSAYLREVNYVRFNTLDNLISYTASSANATGITVKESVAYEYNSNGFITNVILSPLDASIEYAWLANKATKVLEYGGTEVGQILELSYGSGYTDATTTGNDEYIDTDDDIVTRYVFDKYGRSVAVYSSSKSGTEIYGAVTGKYESQENVRNNIKEQAVFGGAAVNYLADGELEVAEGTGFKYWQSSGEVSRIRGNIGAPYCASFKPSANTTAKISQRTSLASGEYTLSFQYKTFDCDGIEGTVTVTGTGISHSAGISLAKNGTNGTSGYFSTSFTVPDSTTKTDVNVEIAFTAGGTVLTSRTLYVDRVMLENNVGASSFNLVASGGFDTSAYTAAGAAVSPATFWQSSTGSAPTIVNTGAEFGNAVYIAGGFSESYVKQSAFILNRNLYDMTQFDNSGQEYIISGFAKASGASMSKDAKFRLRVDVLYYQDSTTPDVRISHYFDFLPGVSDWQLAGGSFSTTYVGDASDTNIYTKITAIEVYCEYYNQEGGYAYFDNISLVNSTGTDVTKYKYYENGLVKVRENLFYSEYYEYDINRNLTRFANNRGELVDYTYDANGLPVSEIHYDFTYNAGYSYPIDDPNRDSLITKTPKHKIENTYNIYGLLTSQCMYILDSAGNVNTSAKSISEHYTYETTQGSRIFGAPLTYKDNADIDTRYYYDSVTGWLEAEINTDSGDGIAYYYDSKGRLSFIEKAGYVSDTTFVSNDLYSYVEYNYNTANQLTSIYSNFSTTYSFAYDVYGNVTSVKAGNKTLATYYYESNNGKLQSVNYGNGFMEDYVYNALELPSEVWYTKSGTRTKAHAYEYTAYGKVHKYTDYVTGTETVYTYDNDRRLIGFVEYLSSSYYNRYSKELSYNDKGQLYTTRYDIDNIYNSTLNSVGTVSHIRFYTTDGKTRKVSLTTPKWRGDENITYDSYGRLSGISHYYYVTGSASTNFRNNIAYTYKETASSTTTLPASYSTSINGGTARTYSYTYDANGYISRIVDTSGYEVRYVYDEIGQLIREDNGYLNKTIVYTYSTSGNRTSKKTYSLTAAGVTPSNPTDTQTYTYGKDGFGDVLAGRNSDQFYLDNLGNPETYSNTKGQYQFDWKGRQLLNGTRGQDISFSFTYNADGIRTSKTVNGVKTTYYVDGNRIIGEETGNKLSIYIYDSAGSPIGIHYREKTYAMGAYDVYWFEKNLQGDVTAIYNSSGTKIVSYVYDAYGNFTKTLNGIASTHVAARNPFTYRGYYYDYDMQFYYIASRYYDPDTGRWLSLDKYVSTGQGFTGYNMFAYCGNNPVMYTDYTGEFAVKLGSLSSDYNLLGAGGNGKVSAGALFVATATVAVANLAISRDKSNSKSIVNTKVETETLSPDTIIYRYYSSKTSNLSPRPGKDFDGLSFSTLPPRANIEYVVTTVGAVNATGIIQAIQTGPTHVVIVPVTGSILDWMKQGMNSPWSYALSSIVIERANYIK